MMLRIINARVYNTDERKSEWSEFTALQSTFEIPMILINLSQAYHILTFDGLIFNI